MKLRVPILAESCHAGIGPDIAAIAAEAPELYIVDVRRVAVLKHEHEFVLRTVETPHSGIGLGPDTKIFELSVGIAGGIEHFAHMPPIHADEVDRAISTGAAKVFERGP